MATAYHAEHVGSLLRPPYLLRAREAHEAGKLTAAQLREVEDRAIAELLDIQKQAGLTVFTDGEALITVDDERRKLDLVVSVAGQVWG